MNISDKKQELFFRNIRPGIDYIDIYILKNKKVVKKFFLGDLREQEKKRFFQEKVFLVLIFKEKHNMKSI